MADDKPIIIIKKKGGHGGHHGGAWKVAYADFVTAMMAFFMVMWLVNSADVTTKQSIASYFRKPGIFESGSGTPLLMGEAGILSDGYVPPHPEDTKQRYSGSAKEVLKGKSGTDADPSGSNRVTYRGEAGKRDSVPDDDVAQRGFLSEEANNPNNAKEIGFTTEKSKQEEADVDTVKTKQMEARTQLENAAAALKAQVMGVVGIEALLGAVEIKVTADGVLLEIMDTDKASMFQSGSARILPEAEQAFLKVGEVIKKLPNKIDIVGHTDAKAFSNRPGGYSNWELSADRANAARRLLDQYGIGSARVENVVGRADKEPKDATNPLSPRNRRITVKLKLDLDAPAPTPQQQPRSVTPAQSIPTTPQNTVAPEAATEETSTHTSSSTSNTPTSERGVKEPTLDPDQIAQKLQKRRREERVKLPTDPSPADIPEPTAAPPSKIFKDRPVIGPPDPFASFD